MRGLKLTLPISALRPSCSWICSTAIFLTKYGSASQLIKASTSQTATMAAAQRSTLRNHACCDSVLEILAWMGTMLAPGMHLILVLWEGRIVRSAFLQRGV